MEHQPAPLTYLEPAAPTRKVSLPSGSEAWLVTTYADVCTVHKDPTFSRFEAARAGATLSKGPSIELEPKEQY